MTIGQKMHKEKNDNGILEWKSVKECNQCLKCATLHPLVSVIDLEKDVISHYSYIKCNFYAVLLLEHSYCDYYYGRRLCDYSDGCMVFLTPEKCFELDMEECDSCLNKGKLLVFHRDLMEGTALESHFEEDYSFFRYQDNESLHISNRERLVVYNCLDEIQKELSHDIDRFSKLLLSRRVELLLDYCRRFYERQFIIRHEENGNLLRCFRFQLEEVIKSDGLRDSKITSNEYWAEVFQKSPEYWKDLLKYETGLTVEEYVLEKSFSFAIQWIRESEKPVGVIAEMLGFPSVYCFNRTFKKMMGCSPNEYCKNLC